jgi:hypothetical protein
MSDDPPRGYEPLKRPVYSAKAIRAAVKRWGNLLGFARPWRIYVNICDSRKGVYCDSSDPGVYASCEPAHSYHRAVLRFDPYHPGFDGEDLDEVVRHELIHAILHSYTEAAHHNAASDAVRAMLETLEEELVGRLSTLPVFDHHTPGGV